MNKKIILVFIAGLVIGGVGFYLYQTQGNLSLSNAGQVAINFINKALEEDNVTASLVGIAEESDVYKLHLKIEDKEYDSFISKDGKYLFSTAFNLEGVDQEETQATEDNQAVSSLETLAKCLTDSGAKFYGAFWCSHCKNQKEMFGQASQYLPYIECSTEDGNDQLAVCKENNVSSYPTWVFPDGTRETGEVPFEKLSEKTGCLFSK